MIPSHSKIGQEMRIHFENLLDEHGKNEFIPVRLENDTPNFYLNWEGESEHYFEKTSQQSGTSLAERIACKSNHNSESTCSTHW